MMKNKNNISILYFLFLAFLILGCLNNSEYDNSDFNSELKRYDNCTNGVASTYPEDGDEHVNIDTSISVNFCLEKDPNSVTTNTYDTSCSGMLTGDLLVSSDDFSTCLKMKTIPFASKSNKTFTVLPSSNLSYNTTYKIRVRTNQYESTAGFKTAIPQPFIAVSNSGEILTSSDGISWDNKSTSISEISCSTGSSCWSIEGIASDGNGTYITTTIGLSSGKIAKTSDGGLTWSLINSGINFYTYDISYGNSRFILSGQSSGSNEPKGVYTSTDGSTWTGGSLPWADSPWAVTYGNGIYIIVGASGKIATSEDASSWTSRDLGSSSAGLYDVDYGNGLYVIVGDKDSIYTSSNGITWSLKYSNGTTASDVLRSVTYGNGRFIAVGNDRTFVKSTDGSNWSLTCTDCTQVDYNGITYGNGLFVAVGKSGTILTSPDGTTWTSRSSGTTNELKGIASY